MAAGSPANLAARSGEIRGSASSASGWQIVGEVRFQRGPVEQMIFGERLARRRGFLEIEHRTYQALQPISPARRFASSPGKPPRRAWRRRNRRQPRALSHRCRAMRPARTPIWSPRSHPRWRPEICARGQAGSPRKQGGSRSFAPAPPQRRSWVSILPRDHAAAMEEDEARQRFARRHSRAHKAGTEYHLRGPAIRRRCRLLPSRRRGRTA